MGDCWASGLVVPPGAPGPALGTPGCPHRRRLKPLCWFGPGLGWKPKLPRACTSYGGGFLRKQVLALCAGARRPTCSCLSRCLFLSLSLLLCLFPFLAFVSWFGLSFGTPGPYLATRAQSAATFSEGTGDWAWTPLFLKPPQP